MLSRSTRLLLLGSLLAGCIDEDVRGNGNVIAQDRDVGAFRAVSVASDLPARIEPGPHLLRLTFDENLLEHVESAVDDGTLELEIDDGVDLTWSAGSVALVRAPTVDDITLSGSSSGTAIMNGPDSKIVQSGGTQLSVGVEGVRRLRAVESGGSRLEVTGAALDELDITASGGSFVNATVPSKRVALQVSGGSDTHVTATEAITVRASGGARVVVRGNPPVRELEVTSSESVRFEP